MSITDELREYVRHYSVAGSSKDKTLTAIADRIDAEHEKALDEWKAEHGQMWLKGYSECHAELLEGNETLASDLERCGWIRLPLDADGVPIHVGDEMTGWDSPQYQYPDLKDLGDDEVWGLLLLDDGWRVENNMVSRKPHELRHYHEPTVEDVLRAMLDALDVDVCADPDATIAEYAAKLRLAGEDE